METSYMGPETSESVSDNSEITQLLSHDCRTISKNFRAKKFFVLKSRFYLSEKSSILIHFSSIWEKMKFSTSNVPKKFSRCPMNMFKVSTMSAYIRAFQRTNSRDHTTHRDKMVQEKQKTGTWDTFWISLLYFKFPPSQSSMIQNSFTRHPFWTEQKFK